ncbi:MAG TPA: riboflavin synthase [Ignavibacteria bacterium]|nr:riboflavin synthase [Ignavibacteria bacterium]
MFTGIVQDTGKVTGRIIKGDSLKFQVEPSDKTFLKDIKAGESISINGACMTVERKSQGKFEFTTVNESLSKTNLSVLKLKDLVNLEKAMTLNSRLDGHIVQGHVDTTGEIKKINTLKDSREYFIEFSGEFRQNVIYVGSISVNGVSLTIAQIINESRKSVLIKVAIIPHTFEVTNFKNMKVNDPVNIEFDMLGKYVKRIFDKKS